MAKRRQRSDRTAVDFSDNGIQIPSDEDVFGEYGSSDLENQPTEVVEFSGISMREIAVQRLEEARRSGASEEEIAELEKKLKEAETQIEVYKQAAIVSVGEKGFVFRNFSLSKVGIEVTGSITEQDADALGYALKKVDSALQFWFGDWANLYLTDGMNDNQRGHVYERLAQEFGIEHRTLNNYASVCRTIAVSLRRETLLFSHHRIVSELPEVLKGRESEFLDKAVKGDEKGIWSVRRLRQEIEIERAKLESARVVEVEDEFNILDAAKAFRRVVKVFTIDVSRLKVGRKDLIRQQIYALRRLLDKAEARLDK